MKWAQYKIELPFKLQSVEPTFFDVREDKHSLLESEEWGLLKGFDLNSLQGGALLDETKTAACEVIIWMDKTLYLLLSIQTL